MKIFVSVKPRAKKEYVKQLSQTEFIVSVKELPIEGRANKAVVKALADFLQIAPGQVILVSGETSKKKVFEIF